MRGNGMIVALILILVALSLPLMAKGQARTAPMGWSATSIGIWIYNSDGTAIPEGTTKTWGSEGTQPGGEAMEGSVVGRDSSEVENGIYYEIWAFHDDDGTWSDTMTPGDNPYILYMGEVDASYPGYLSFGLNNIEWDDVGTIFDANDTVWVWLMDVEDPFQGQILPKTSDWTPEDSIVVNYGPSKATFSVYLWDSSWAADPGGVDVFFNLIPIPASVTEKQRETPRFYALKQNTPNPFNASTTIEYALRHDEDVHLDIYDLNGHRIKTVVNTHQKAGYYKVVWNGTDDEGNSVGSGAYLYKIKAGHFEAKNRMLLIK